MKTKILFLILIGILVYHNIMADIPREITFQGILLDNSGTLMQDGNYTCTFRLYDQESGGTSLWTDVSTITVENGSFSTILGENNPIPVTLTFDIQYWLGIQIEQDQELNPRLKLTSVPYSLNSFYTKRPLDPQIETIEIEDYAIETEKINNLAVTTDKLDANSVIASKITNGTVIRSITIFPQPSIPEVFTDHIKLIGGAYISVHKNKDSIIINGSCTNLNDAYNCGNIAGDGRIINANAGPVEIQGSDGLLVTGISRVIEGNGSGNLNIIKSTTYGSGNAFGGTVTTAPNCLGDGKVADFRIINPNNHSPALNVSTDGTGSGVYAVSGASTTFTYDDLVGAVYGNSKNQQGVVGLSESKNGVYGRTMKQQTFTISPDAIVGGIRGYAYEYGIDNDNFAVVGTASGTATGTGVLGVGSKNGFGLFGIAGVAEYDYQQYTSAGVRGITAETNNDSEWPPYFPLIEGGNYGKDQVGVLGQALDKVGVWGESVNHFGVVGNTGQRMSIAVLPQDIAGVYGYASQLDGVGVLGMSYGGVAGMFKITNPDNGHFALSAETNSTANAFNCINSGYNGCAAYFEKNERNNPDPAVMIRANGGYGALIDLDYPTGVMPALWVTSNHFGQTIQAISDGYGDCFQAVSNNFGGCIQALSNGTGGAGEFKIYNTNNNEPVLYIENYGMGYSMAARTLWANNPSHALYVETRGLGRAANFLINNASNTEPALYAYTNGLGRAGSFIIANTINTSTGLFVQTSGLGRIASFQSDNTSNTETGVYISTYGSGATLGVYNRGTGRAGNFQIESSSNGESALYASTTGTGRAGNFQISNSTNSSTALHASTSGRGRAANFQITNSSNSDIGLYVQTQGTGQAASIQINNSSSHANALYVWSNSSEEALNVYSDEGKAAVFTGDVSMNNNLTVDGDFAIDGDILSSVTIGTITSPRTLSVTGATQISGNLNVVGFLTKGGGTFKIDHPLDPENKYLNHSFVESNEMKNVYDGVITLDNNGEAVVQLPDWFEALNKDFRYQLTCIGKYAQVYIAEEISNNQFKIAGGCENLKVCWSVTGVRKDPFANAHRVIVEEEKPDNCKGLYLHPAEYGLSIEKNIIK